VVRRLASAIRTTPPPVLPAAVPVVRGGFQCFAVVFKFRDVWLPRSFFVLSLWRIRQAYGDNVLFWDWACEVEVVGSHLRFPIGFFHIFFFLEVNLAWVVNTPCCFSVCFWLATPFADGGDCFWWIWGSHLSTTWAVFRGFGLGCGALRCAFGWFIMCLFSWWFSGEGRMSGANTVMVRQWGGCCGGDAVMWGGRDSVWCVMSLAGGV